MKLCLNKMKGVRLKILSLSFYNKLINILLKIA
nr:MAG TPA: Putative integron gene cassette protein [Caudoviricetes sp.]